jgi:hypothetical protein
MERESVKHNPQLDDQLKHETESLVRGAPVEAHSDESLRQEEPADFEPAIKPNTRPDLRPEPGNSVTPAEANMRAEIARLIPPHLYPTGKDELIAHLEQDSATTHVIEWLRLLPADRTYENSQDVWEALGGEVEGHHT